MALLFQESPETLVFYFISLLKNQVAQHAQDCSYFENVSAKRSNNNVTIKKLFEMKTWLEL